MADAKTPILIWLVRSGASDWIVEGRIRGSADLPLSDSGREAMREAASTLADNGVAQVIHPPDEAATESAQIIAKVCGAKTRGIDDLADPDLGLLEGLTLQAFAERYPKRHKAWREDPLACTPPDGEDPIEARARIFAALERALKKAKAPVAVVLHDFALGVFKCWLADTGTSSMWALIENGSAFDRYEIERARLGHLARDAIEQQSA